MSRLNYNIRKLYVILHPLLNTKDFSNRTQWIMRNSSLISGGIPFFLEPFLNSDDKWGFEKRGLIELTSIFLRNLYYHAIAWKWRTIRFIVILLVIYYFVSKWWL